MPTLRVSLLGPVDITLGDRRVLVPSMRKAQELLAIVLLAPRQSVLRETAADSLWPSADPTVSRKAMRQALWQIHQAVDTSVSESRRLIVADAETIRVNPDRAMWLDVTAFVAAAETARDSLADSLEPATLRTMGEAALLYRGVLLDGCYEDWCLVDRAHLEDLYITLLDRLSTAHERGGELQQAITWAQRLLEAEPAHERSHRRLMQMYAQTDDRTRALRQWQRCQWVLEHELGVRPSAPTERLAAEIGVGGSETRRADDSPAAGPRSAGGASHVRGDGRDAVLGAQVADSIEGLRQELASLRRMVDGIAHQLRA